jgi:hypothetical protein
MLVAEELREVNQRLFCEVKIENPQFVLYDNQHELSRTNSLIIDGVFFFNLNQNVGSTKIYAALNNFMIRLKSAKTKRFQKQVKYLILSPAMLSFTGIIDENDESESMSSDKPETSFILDLQEINFNLCPLMLNTSLKMAQSIQDSLNRRFATKKEATRERSNSRDETSVSFHSLFQVKYT